jgi:hypothetical protein
LLVVQQHYKDNFDVQMPDMPISISFIRTFVHF